MALYKEITKDNGITVVYHKIKSVSVMMRTPRIDEETNETDNTHLLSVKVKSYVSEDYRRVSEDNAVASRDYTFRVTLAEIAETPILELAYAELKAEPIFEGAEDC